MRAGEGSWYHQTFHTAHKGGEKVPPTISSRYIHHEQELGPEGSDGPPASESAREQGQGRKGQELMASRLACCEDRALSNPELELERAQARSNPQWRCAEPKLCPT